jgi:SAM-dependent methyltransferase
MEEGRKERERNYHDGRFACDPRKKLGKYYSVNGGAKNFYARNVYRDCNDKKVLEYGCGTGSLSFDLMIEGARVTGIDISEVAISKAKEMSLKKNACGDLRFAVMDAEELAFDADEFSVVCGSGILHHLDVERAFKELSRVLKKEGRAVFVEPLGYNPLINLYRKMTPKLRSKDEHPLTRPDIELAGKYFGDVHIKHFHLLSLMAVPLRRVKGFHLLKKLVDRADAILLGLPLVKWFSWMVVLELKSPRKNVEEANG